MAIDQTGRNLCYLIGPPRGGTTLLSFLLDQHPAVTAPAEPWLMLALEAFGRLPLRHPAEANMIGRAVDEFLDVQGRREVIAAMAAAAYNRCLEQAGASLLVDKTPRYWQILDFLHDTLPAARFLVLLRNPFAVLASLKSTWGSDPCADWRGGGEPQFRAFDVGLGFRRIRDFIARHRGSPLVVRYESLVADPAATLDAVQDFLGLEHLIDPARADFGGAYAGSFMGDKKIRGSTGIHAGSLDAWTSQLSPAELQAGYDLLGSRLLRDLGYGEALDRALSLGVTERSDTETEATAAELEHLFACRRADVARCSHTNAALLRLREADDLAFADADAVLENRHTVAAQQALAAAQRQMAEQMAGNFAALQQSFAENLDGYRRLIEQSRAEIDGLHASYHAQIAQHRDIIRDGMAELQAKTAEIALLRQELDQARAATAGLRGRLASLLSSRVIRSYLALRGVSEPALDGSRSEG